MRPFVFCIDYLCRTPGYNAAFLLIALAYLLSGGCACQAKKEEKTWAKVRPNSRVSGDNACSEVEIQRTEIDWLVRLVGR